MSVVKPRDTSAYIAPLRLLAIRTHRERVVIAACAAASLVVLWAVATRAWNGAYLNHVSGSLAVLGLDAAEGVFYRPLLSELGYGGTRNFPLHIALHGLFIALGLPVRAAGHLISIGSGIAIVAAAATALQRVGAPARYAWAAGVVALASRTAVEGMAGIRADILPVALGLWGLAVMPRSSRESAWPAAMLFALAVAAKPTLAWAPTGAVLSLWVARRFRDGVRLSVYTAGAMAVCAALAMLLSGGAILTSLQACASGGGFSLEQLVETLGRLRPGEAMWILGGVTVVVVRGRAGLAEPIGFASVVCLPTTLALLSSRGTNVNHLIDSSVIGAVALASGLWHVTSGRRLVAATYLTATALALLEIAFLSAGVSERDDFTLAAAALPAGSAPVLSEQAWIPIVAGETPYLLDGYNLVLMREKDPSFGEDLFAKLDRCAFRAVVLLGRASRAERWYDDTSMGPGFREHLLEHYTLQEVTGGHTIYVPSCDMPPQPSGPRMAGVTIFDRYMEPSPLRRLLHELRGR